MALPLFYNVNASVGRNAVNQREDVVLVTWLLKTWLSHEPDLRLNDLAADMTVGFADDALVNAILELEQRQISGGQSSHMDGRVSPALGNDITYHHGSGGYLICMMNYMMAHNNSRVWPRLEQIAGCPPELRELVRRTVFLF